MITKVSSLFVLRSLLHPIPVCGSYWYFRSVIWFYSEGLHGPCSFESLQILTYWGRNKMTTIFFATFSNSGSWKLFYSNFIETCSQGSNNQWWTLLQTHIYVTRPRWVKTYVYCMTFFTCKIINITAYHVVQMFEATSMFSTIIIQMTAQNSATWSVYTSLYLLVVFIL